MAQLDRVHFAFLSGDNEVKVRQCAAALDKRSIHRQRRHRQLMRVVQLPRCLVHRCQLDVRLAHGRLPRLALVPILLSFACRPASPFDNAARLDILRDRAFIGQERVHYRLIEK